jgi:hypothetical protein
MKMRNRRRFCLVFSQDGLDRRVSLTSLLPSVAMVVPPVSPPIRMDDEDPLPDPEPSPGPYPCDDPPIDHPELPPSGPVGPGRSNGLR